MSGYRLLLVVAAAGTWACGNSDDGGGGAGGSGSGLAGLLKGFGKAAEGSTGGSGAPGLDTDGGLPSAPAGGGVSAASCQTICDRVVACIPEGGCPNFARLPDAQRDQVVAQCVPACRTGLTEEALSAVNAATCTEIFQEISAGEADVEAFCALEPASAADCTAFCEQLRGCGSELTDELCQLTCLYGAGVRCIRQNGTCQAPECGALFPSE